MRIGSTKVSRRGLSVGLAAASALFVVACEPGWVNPVAGTGQSGSTGDGGAAVDATFEQPGSLVYERATGAYYVVDTAACVIRKVDPDHTISTVAGNGTCGYSGDGGAATDAEIDPSVAGVGGGLAEDATGDLYLADTANGAIRKVTSDGAISTLASGFGDPGRAVTQVAVSTTGAVYASAQGDGIVEVAPDGTQTQVVSFISDAIAADPAGGLVSACSGICNAETVGLVHLDEGSWVVTDLGSPPGSSAPPALAVDASGNVYETVDDHVVRVDPEGTVTTIAGNGSGDPGTTAQQGPALDLALTPKGLAVTANDGLLVSSGHVVYRLDQPAAAVAPTSTVMVPVSTSIEGAG